MEISKGDYYYFTTTRCGVMGKDGCYKLVGEYTAEYIGIGFHAGKMVYKFKNPDGLTCQHCGRQSSFTYLETVEIDGAEVVNHESAAEIESEFAHNEAQ